MLRWSGDKCVTWIEQVGGEGVGTKRSSFGSSLVVMIESIVPRLSKRKL